MNKDLSNREKNRKRRARRAKARARVKNLIEEGKKLALQETKSYVNELVRESRKHQKLAFDSYQYYRRNHNVIGLEEEAKKQHVVAYHHANQAFGLLHKASILGRVDEYLGHRNEITRSIFEGKILNLPENPLTIKN